MILEDIDDLVEAKPFVPFTINTADGLAVEVQHPKWILVSPTERSMHVVNQTGKFKIIATNLITSIEAGHPSELPEQCQRN